MQLTRPPLVGEGERLLVTGGTWINKAARTASGTDATANSTAKVVQFGAGGGG